MSCHRCSETRPHCKLFLALGLTRLREMFPGTVHADMVSTVLSHIQCSRTANLPIVERMGGWILKNSKHPCERRSIKQSHLISRRRQLNDEDSFFNEALGTAPLIYLTALISRLHRNPVDQISFNLTVDLIKTQTSLTCSMHSVSPQMKCHSLH